MAVRECALSRRLTFRWKFPVAIVRRFVHGQSSVLHVDSRVSIVMEQFLRLMHACGMPTEDVDLIHCDGQIMGELLEQLQLDDAVHRIASIAEQLRCS